MATSSNVDFDYCEVCRQSHRKGKKHLFSKTHRDKMKHTLSRFGEKIKLAKADMAAPCILPGSKDVKGSFWCYMCKKEVTKHVSDGQVTIRHAGFIEHLKSGEHLVKTDIFWKEYRLERTLKLKYVLTQDDYRTFKPALEKALDMYEGQQNEDISKRAAEIRTMEAKRQNVFLQDEQVKQGKDSESGGAYSIPYTSGNSSNHSNNGEGGGEPGCSYWKPTQHPKPSTAHDSNPSSQQHRSNHSNQGYSRKATSTVLNSGGLTSIRIQMLRPGEGNIHTGATPPWLLDDDNDDAGSHMPGPSLEDFNKHLERERKRKLNPNRVGANFDHVTPTREEWLPSFGGVWNHGRRLQSRHQFKKETGQVNSNAKRKKIDQEKKPPATVSKPP